MSETIARNVVVSGHVQGVFFRDRTRRKATQLGVSGWVRNCPDGTVQAHFEGSPDAVAELVRWCREGPRHATVNEVTVSAAEPQGAGRFEIR
jgi:acylphosphatase